MFSYLLNEKGATAIEYVLLVAGIGVLIIGALFAFGGDLASLFESLSGTTGTGE